MQRTTLSAALMSALTAASPATAATQIFDFEAVSSPKLTSQGWAVFAAADGWTSSTNGIEIQARGVAGSPFSGSNLVELDTFANSSMSLALGAGSYAVSYWYSARPGVAAGSNGIDLSIGSTLLDSVTANGGGHTQWQSRSVNFATTGGNLTFSAAGKSDSLGGYLDHISVAAVPEPATWALMIGGFGMVGAAMRRRQAATAAAVTA